MVQKMPSLRGIEAFLTLVQTGGVRATARHLNISVSAVSHRLRLLEAEAGTRLFERRMNKLILTAKGKALHEDLEPISAALQAAMVRLSQQRDLKELSVSASSVIISYWLTGRIATWREQNPDVRLSLHTLRDGAAEDHDIVIKSVFDEQPEPSDLLLFEWRLGPICRPEVVEKYHLRSPEDILRAPLIDMEQPVGGWDAWLGAAGLKKRQRDMLLDSHDLMIDAASEGLGAAIGAIAMLPAYSRLGLVMPFNVTCKIPGGAYVNAPRSGESRLAWKFREWLKTQAAR